MARARAEYAALEAAYGELFADLLDAGALDPDIERNTAGARRHSTGGSPFRTRLAPASEAAAAAAEVTVADDDDSAAVLIKLIESDVRRVRQDADELASLGVRCACARVLFLTALDLARVARVAGNDKPLTWFYRQPMSELLGVIMTIVVRVELNLF